MSDEPRPLTESLDELVRSLKGGTRADLGGVFARWDDVVGPLVAAHARPVRLDSGRLAVEVDEPAWATELRFLEADLCRRFADVAGVAVTALEVRVARRPWSGPAGA